MGKSVVFNVVYQGLNVVFPLISVTYVAKILSPGGLGSVVSAQNFVSYFLMIAILGMPTYGTREIAQCGNDRGRISRVFSELVLINAVSTALCIAVYGIVVAEYIKEDRLLYLICGLELLFNFINVDWFYRGREDFVYITIRSLIVKIILLFALFALVKDRDDCNIYALIVCLANGCNFLFNVIRLRKEVKFVFRNLNIKRHIKPLLMLLLCTVAASLYSKVDITMLGSMQTNVSVGLYSTALKIIGITTGVVASATSVFLPRISYCYKTDKEKIDIYISKGLEMVVFISVPAAIGIAMVAPDLMAVLFGQSYVEAHFVIKILSPLLVIKGIGDLLCYQVLVSAGKEDKFLISYVIAAIANIQFNSILIPRMDYNGAAIASVISELIVNISLLRYSIQIVRPNIGRKFCMTILVGSLVMSVVIKTVQSLGLSETGQLLTAVSGGCLTYLGVNLLLKNSIMQIILEKTPFSKKQK